jgi:hypothetical protein
MDTPIFQQLTGLLTTVKAGLRASSYLVTGVGVDDLGYTADEVCKTVYPHKLFIVQSNGIATYPAFGKAQCPALAIFIEDADPVDIDGGIGMNCNIGIQYAFLARAKDITSQAFAAHFAMTIWWEICDIITSDLQSVDANKDSNSALRKTYHIDELGLGSMNLLPPFSDAIRAFEATGSMDFKRPMWDTGEDSNQVVDLASVYSNHNETSDVGGAPTVQSIYTVPE